MKFKLFVAIIIVFFIPIASICTPAGRTSDEVVIAMCRPSVSQIKNIEQLYERDLIQLKRIKLLGVFHKDEKTNYTPSFEYVKANSLSWISFVKIKGQVEMDQLFKDNLWTQQFKTVFEQADGIVFTGGMDIPPALYSEERHLLTRASTPVRSFYEVSFLFHLVGGSQDPSFKPFLASNREYPILAICLGAQSLNVAAGGTLIQDIPSQVYGKKMVEQVIRMPQGKIHTSGYIKSLSYFSKDIAPAFHAIKLSKSNLMVRRMGFKTSDRPQILTSHHQAIKKVGKNLLVTATSEDGKIVEMVEHQVFKNVIGVQFHPEPFTLYQKGKWYRQKPGQPLDHNLRDFLVSHQPSMKFHRKLWQWFSSVLLKQKNRK